MRKLIRSICFICLISLLIIGCTSTGKQIPQPQEDWRALVPTEYQPDFENALSLAGDNRDTLISVMKTVPPEQRPGVAFLLSTMSYPDVVSISKDVLLEHIRYAYLAKSKYPWMRNMPEDIFLHYVLPYRCAEEPISAYRKYFYEQLDPIVSQLDNMSDVAHQVNLWLGAPKADGKQRVRFVQTEARDQGPLATLKSGYGRCEEMMIVYMSVARSVGIPCRSAWTQYWATCDNNHAWVEVWLTESQRSPADGGKGYWKPMGGCEPGGVWFEHPAKRAAVVYSVTVGKPAASDLLHKSFGTVSTINSTPNYSKICTINATVLDSANSPVSGTTVAFAVFNWGSFRPVGTKMTDALGKCQFITGIGEYFLSTGKAERSSTLGATSGVPTNVGNDLRAWQVVKTQSDKTLEITLQLAPDNAPDGYVFLRYPTPEEARVSFNTPVMAPKHTALLTPTAPPPPEVYFYEEFSPTLHADVMALLEGSPQKDAVVKKLIDAGGNWTEIADAIKECKPELRPDLFWLIGQLAHLEAIEVTKEFLLDNVNIADSARKNAEWKIPDDIYRAYILNHAFQYLHISNWRNELILNSNIPWPPWERRRKATPGAWRQENTITDTARAINEWVQNNIKLKDDLRGRFSYIPSPLDTFRSKVGDGYGIAVFTAGLLRTLGVPAKVKNDWVEFYDGTNWLPLYPHDLKNFVNIQRDEKTASEYTVQPAGLCLNMIVKGVPEANPLEKIAISRFQNGYWGYLDWDELKRSGKWLAIPPGQYLVTAGVRNSNGDAMVYCKQLDFKPGEGVTLDVPMDIPLDRLLEADRVVRKLDKVPMFELPDLEGKIYNLTETLKTKAVILTFFSLDNEPSIRMLPMIDQLKDKAASSGAGIWAVYIDFEGKAKFVKDGRLASLKIPVLLDSNQAVVKQFIPEFDKNKQKCLPSTLVIRHSRPASVIPPDKSGGIQVLMWNEGYNMAIADTIESALGLLAGAVTTPASTRSEPKITRQPLVIGPNYLADAERLYKEGNYDKSIEMYLKALEQNPDDAGTWYNLACDYSLLGKIDDALNALKKAVEKGYADFNWMDKDPDLEKLRKDPKYKELRK